MPPEDTHSTREAWGRPKLREQKTCEEERAEHLACDGVFDALRRLPVLLVERTGIVDQRVNLTMAARQLIRRLADGIEIARVGNHVPDLR